MKESRLKAMQAHALDEQAQAVIRLEESVKAIGDLVQAIMQTVTEIRENLPAPAPVKAGKPKEPPASE